jgi:cell wall-associated NlpC family hydrolase
VDAWDNANFEGRKYHRMIVASELVAAMRNRIGAKFVIDARSDNETDCAGVIVQAAAECGCKLVDMPPEETAKARTHSSLTIQWAKTWGKQRQRGSKPQDGDLLLIWLVRPNAPCHVAIYAAKTNTIIHARPRKGVTETPYVGMWDLRTSHVFRLHDVKPH